MSFLFVLVCNKRFFFVVLDGNSNGISKKGEEEQKICTIISIYHQTPAASSKFIKQLCQVILQTEQALLIEASSPFREVLMKFLHRYPSETLDMFLSDNYIKVNAIVS